MTAVTITATYNGVAKTATLTVNPPASRAGRRERQSGGRHRPGGQHGHGDARRSGAGRRRSGDAEEQQRQCARC